MNRNLTYIFLLLISSLCASCTKNEVTLTGRLDNAEGRTITIVYRASDKEKSFLSEVPVPLVNDGSFTIKASTRYPTVLWLMSADGSVLAPLYAERGDELKVNGNYAEPWGWKFEGNKVMEQYTEWASDNRNILKSGDSEKINASITKYVKKDPKSLTAAFLVYAHFRYLGHEQEFRQVCGMLKADSDDLRLMQEACMIPAVTATPPAPTIAPFTLPAAGDTLQTVSPADARATLICFWRTKPENAMHELLSKTVADTTLQAVTVYMDADSFSWERIVTSDSTLKKCKALWALGAEVNDAVRKMGVPSTPYLIVTDASGKVTYRGDSPAEAESKLSL